jgi:hypothetical protein
MKILVKIFSTVVALALIWLLVICMAKNAQEQHDWVPCRSEEEFNKGNCGVNE